MPTSARSIHGWSARPGPRWRRAGDRSADAQTPGLDDPGGVVRRRQTPCRAGHGTGGSTRGAPADSWPLLILAQEQAMFRPSRREFLIPTALAPTTAGPARPRPPPAAEPNKEEPGPDLVVVNGVVHTVDDRLPRAEGFAVKNGRFIAVGGNDEVRGLATKTTQVIDAKGMTVVPGFIDAHCHPASTGIEELIEVDCNRPTIAEIKDAIRERAARTKAGEWVFGFKYDDTKLKDGRPLTRADLDDAAPKHPVRVVHRGGHTAVVNSLAFQLAEVTRETRDPEGGKFGRDDKGELTGFVA